MKLWKGEIQMLTELEQVLPADMKREVLRS